MKALGVACAITAILAVITHGLALLAVDVNAAGALLSPAGALDPVPWLVAGSYALARIGGAAITCATLALAVALLVSRALAKK